MKPELDAPNVGNLEKRYLNKAIDSGFVSTFGPFIPEFEKKFAQYVGVKKAVSIQSGTAAIHMALKELEIGEGDEVIVPVLTFIATVNPVRYVAAEPIFVDVDPKTWNIVPEEIERNITKRTKAIIPVHLYGNPCDMDAIMNIAKKHNIHVIEDATESLGAKYKNRHTGIFGDFGCFSFNGNKIITTGGGGMIVGSDGKKLEHIKYLVNQAKGNPRTDYHSEIGFNYRMTNTEAAIGLAQMKRLEGFLQKKKKFNEIYKEDLKDIGFIRFQEEYEDSESSWWLTCIIFEKEINLMELQKKLEHKEIPTRRIFMPITEFLPYTIYKKAKYKNAYYLYNKGLCLPSSTLNSENDIHYVCKILKDLLK